MTQRTAEGGGNVGGAYLSCSNLIQVTMQFISVVYFLFVYRYSWVRTNLKMNVPIIQSRYWLFKSGELLNSKCRARERE